MKWSVKLKWMIPALVLILASCKAQKQNEMASQKLVNQKYTITEINNQDVSDSKLTLKVNTENKTISGFSGCNNYSFNYKVNEGVLDLGYAMATKMYCEGAMELENLFFKTTSAASQFERTTEYIVLKSKEGDVILRAKTKDSE
jgi:heat shock protein HslJ